jgi:hypothetical protein
VVVTSHGAGRDTADKVRDAIARCARERGARHRSRWSPTGVPQGRRGGRGLHAARPHRDRRRETRTPSPRCASCYAPFQRNHEPPAGDGHPLGGAHQVRLPTRCSPRASRS